jgi:hypothetical protein
MGRRIAVVGTLLIALFGAPRTSHAGLLEIIWEMSGPQMIGSGLSCVYSVTLKKQECLIGGMFLKPEAERPTNPHGPFLVLGGAAFTSTDRNSATQAYEWFDANMVAFEPGVMVVSVVDTPASPVRFSHAVGLSYGLLFGKNFRTFDKAAFLIAPVDVTYKKIAFGPKIRIYPNGFTDDEFGFGPRLDFDRPPEITLGFSFAYIWR